MFRSLILALIITLVSGAAFVPAPSAPSTAAKGTKLSFGFLKELGLEKPSWLPDFGGKKDEEPPAEATAEESTEGEATEDEETSE